MSKRIAISVGMRFKIMKRDNFKCCVCGRSPSTSNNVELEVDHIKPVSKGGSNHIDNLRTVCFECNRGKRDKIIDINTEQTGLGCVKESTTENKDSAVFSRKSINAMRPILQKAADFLEEKGYVKITEDTETVNNKNEDKLPIKIHKTTLPHLDFIEKILLDELLKQGRAVIIDG